ncbi:MAG: flavin reductase family protein [Rubrobacteraceae bacterium]
MPADSPRDAGEHRDLERGGVNADSLRAAMRLFPTGVTVVTSGREENAEGMTANAVISVSLDPPLFLVSVHKEARLNPRIKEAEYFAASILARDQEGLSRLFASPERSSGLAAISSLGGGYGVTGAPLVAGALATIECELEAVYPGGDHELFLGRVVSTRLGDERKGPLVYHEGDYPALNAPPRAGETGAFVDSVRGFDARLSRFQSRGKRR